jgi:hypothetical protein
MHSGHMLREGARSEMVGTTWVTRNIGVTQNVYGKGLEERVDAVTQAVEAVTNAAQNAEKEEKKSQSQPSIHDSPYAPLRGVPEVPYSISGWFQPVPERIAAGASGCSPRAMDPVLFLRQAGHFESMEFNRLEDIRSLRSSAWPRLRSSQGDRAGRARCGRQCVMTDAGGLAHPSLISTPERAPSLCLLSSQTQGGDFDFLSPPRLPNVPRVRPSAVLVRPSILFITSALCSRSLTPFLCHARVIPRS